MKVKTILAYLIETVSHSIFKRDTVAKEQIHTVCNPVVYESDVNPPLIRPEMSKNNKWLYPTNEIGKMEEGVVD